MKIEYCSSDYSYNEWGNLGLDWSNRYKVKYCVEAYLFRQSNYLKGLNNLNYGITGVLEHIIKSNINYK
jgi:hypothetical protein